MLPPRPSSNSESKELLFTGKGSAVSDIVGMSAWAGSHNRPVFPMDAMGFPVLREDVQTSMEVLSHRWVRWGDRHPTWRAQQPTVLALYTDDTRFASLWTRPDQVSRRGCISAVVEPNYTTTDDMSRVLLEHAIYRKRWTARCWQELGISPIVDVHVCESIRPLALAGVPRSWQIYCTKWIKRDGMEPLIRDWQMVCEHRGDDRGTLAVFGGYSPKLTQELQDRGWHHIPQENRGDFQYGSRYGDEKIVQQAGHEPASAEV